MNSTLQFFPIPFEFVADGQKKGNWIFHALMHQRENSPNPSSKFLTFPTTSEFRKKWDQMEFLKMDQLQKRDLEIRI